MKIIAILGRENLIGYAELASLYGDDNISLPLENVAVVETDNWDYPRIGSTKKSGIMIKKTNKDSLIKEIQKFIKNEIRKIHPERKKINFGVSVYGDASLPITEIEKSVNQSLSEEGFNPRRVPNETGVLSTAQVFHNKLDISGLELLIINAKEEVIIGRTSEVQNIISYRKRDQERPARDPKLGMLPPKLAQTMINMAADGLPKSGDLTVLDPFCGTGVVLQEALLMGFKAFGSDISQNVIDLCNKNMKWLESRFNRVQGKWTTETADATKHQWKVDPDMVVSELYLGPPLSEEPSMNELEHIMEDSEELVKSTLLNLKLTVKKGGRLCLAVPAWNVNNKLYTLPLVDDLRGLGYNRIRFNRVNNELVYRREDQIVGRHLLVLERI